MANHSMLGNMCDDLIGLVLGLALLLSVRQCIKFWEEWATTRAAAVDNDNSQAHRSRSSSSEAPVLLHSRGDHPQRVNADLISTYEQDAGTWTRSGELKVTCGDCYVRVSGTDREPFADMFFTLDCTRSARHTRVRLTLDQIDFGVGNCCTQNSCFTRNQSCDTNCKTVFINKMTIQVSPHSWARDCRRLQLQPHHTAEVFGLQRNSNVSFQMPFVRPRQASVTYQTGNTVCRSAPAFGWGPACRDATSNSVSWTWELHRDVNGRKVEFNKHKWGSRPPLGIRPSHTHIHPGSFLAEASWELQPSAELQQHRLEWDVKVSLHTAAFQTKRRLPGYSVTTGPMLSYKKVLAFS